jgi:hypothetical protein
LTGTTEYAKIENNNQPTKLKKKNMKAKIIISIMTAAGLVGCAMQPAIKSDNPANITMRFKSENNKSVMTFWREMKADGTKGSRFMVGVDRGTALMNMNFAGYAPNVVQLDPGAYFLDSYQAPVSSKPGVAYCVSQGGHYMTRNGWDDENKRPVYMSFIVKENQNLTLPMVQFDADCKPTITDDKTGITFGEKFQ